MGTGLGGESYAIIGQERIGQLLSSKPGDRRSIIEEAAGITRFKTKKRLAELRLESARQNLSRVNDIFEEVTKQMTVLKRQAAKAERYGQLRDDLRSRLRVVLASRMHQIDTESAAITARIAELTTTIDANSADIDAMDGEYTAGMQHGYTLDAGIRDANTAANKAAVELERITARSAANTDRVAELVTRIDAGTADLAAAREGLAGLTAELEEHRSFLGSATSASEAAREGVRGHQLEAAEATRAVAAAEAQLETTRRQALQLMGRANALRNEIAQAEASLAALDRESERLVAESGTAREELAALGQQRGQVKLSFESVTERLRRLEAEIGTARLDLEARRKEESDSKRRGDHLRGEVASLNGRRNSLEGLIRDHSYSTDTVKNIFKTSARRASQNPGADLAPIGTLADFLEVEGQYGSVVDEFLRDELNYVVVKNWQSADEGIRLLKSDVTGRATFLIHGDHTATPPSPHQPTPRPEAEGLVPLRDCVRVLNGFGSSLETLLPKLRDGYVAPDADTARTLAEAHPQAWFLAPSGETFHALTVTGGRPSSGGPLALKRDLRELSAKLEAAQADLSRTDVATATLTRQIAEITATIDAHTHERRDAERESANSGAALRQMETETARIERRLNDWQLATERNRDGRNSKADLIERRNGEIAALDAEHAALDVRLAELTASLNGLRSGREALQAAAAAAAADLAGLDERRRNAQANFDQTTRLVNGQNTRIGQIEAQLASAAGEKQRREEETATLAGQHGALVEARAIALGDSARLTAEAAQLRARLADLDTSLRSLRATTDALREERGHLSARGAKLSSDTEHIDAVCLNDLGADPAALRKDESIARIEGDALSAQEDETRTLKGKLEAMGPVNMMALEEFTETSERHSFLEVQRKDLLDSIENTRDAIKEIDDVSRIKFDEAFRIINSNFSTTFSKLFGGGQASMKLTDAENSAESGIDILASPPGKKLQNILLLSGGEKALTALSLLVGIFQFQPAPFCILDEVDAPLDETNVGRYAQLISEMAEHTQFIAITHNKRTMAQADVIYGVTMQEPGVSKVVSVNLGSRAKADNRRAVA